MLKIQTPTNPAYQLGLTMIELVIVMALSIVLVAAIVQIASASSRSFRFQENQAEVLENSRHSISLLSRLIRQAGFTPEPWSASFPVNASISESTDQASVDSDRLVIRFWSDTNCFENLNPVTDEEGQPVFHIRESLFDLNSRKDLALTCRYGPDSSSLETQINHHGLIQNVESFQLLFGEDVSGNGQVDHWVDAGKWSDPKHILAVKVGLLFRSTYSVLEPFPHTHQVLDHTFTSRADGRIRKLVNFTTRIRSSMK